MTHSNQLAISLSNQSIFPEGEKEERKKLRKWQKVTLLPKDTEVKGRESPSKSNTRA